MKGLNCMGKIMAVDYGDKRTGLAISDVNAFLASPLFTINEISMKKVVAEVSNKAKENAVIKIIVGYPINMNGSVGERAKKTEKFAKLLSDKSGIEVVLWDERSTTVSAYNIFDETKTFGKKRKDNVDVLAATIILQSYLDK